MDKETREFIEKMFCNINIKIDRLYFEVKELEKLQLNYIKVYNSTQDSDEIKNQVSSCSKIRKKEIDLVPRKRTIVPHFKTKVERMNEDLLKLLR